MSVDDLKRRVRQHIDLTWNRGRLALAEQLQSRDFLYKSSFVGHPLDSRGYCELIARIREGMPGLEVIVEECIGEGRKVVTWSTLIGSIDLPTLGYPVSDRIISISAMAFWSFNSLGEIEEICTMFDMENFRAQLGLNSRPYAEKALP